jgi:hypothetical protein
LGRVPRSTPPDAQYSHEPCVAVARNWTRYLKPAFRHLGARTPGSRSLEMRLRAHPWLTDAAMTIADIARVHPRLRRGLTRYPVVRAWLDRAHAYPSIRALLSPRVRYAFTPRVRPEAGALRHSGCRRKVSLGLFQHEIALGHQARREHHLVDVEVGGPCFGFPMLRHEPKGLDLRSQRRVPQDGFER